MSLRAIARLLAVGSLIAVLHGPTATLAQDSPSPCNWKGELPFAEVWDLTGRLGSTREAFEAKYGTPKTDGTSQLFPEYNIPGCGPVLVTWSPDNYLVTLDLFSPRKDEHKGFENHDEADWTLGEAQSIAVNFAPLDAQYDDMGLNPPPYGYWFKVGYSDALINQVPATAWDYSDNTPTYGTFLLTLNIIDADIYHIGLTFGYEPEDTPAQ